MRGTEHEGGSKIMLKNLNFLHAGLDEFQWSGSVVQYGHLAVVSSCAVDKTLHSWIKMAEKQGILSEAEAAAERAKLRNTLKAEFQKKLTHPFRHGHGEGGFVVFIFLSNQFQPHWLEFVNHNVLSTILLSVRPCCPEIHVYECLTSRLFQGYTQNHSLWSDVVSHPVPLFGLHYPDPEGMNYLLNNFKYLYLLISLNL